MIRVEFYDYRGTPINPQIFKVKEDGQTAEWEITTEPSNHRIGTSGTRGVSAMWVISDNAMILTGATTFDNNISEMRQIQFIQLTTSERTYEQFVLSI